MGLFLLINPNNLIKLDEIKTDGETLRVDYLPPYEQEDYDLSNPKDFAKFIRDVKSEIRSSFEYREMVKYLRNYGGMNHSGLNPNVSNNDSSKVKIEIHHTPYTLEDITKAVYEKRLFYHQDLSLEMVAKEVMSLHYLAMIGLFPLSSTEHEMVHNGYLYIPPNDVFGNWELFKSKYRDFMDEEDNETIEDIKEYEKVFNVEKQNEILSQANIYIDASNVYDIPQLDTLKDSMSNRIDTIKNNMYSLPVLGEDKIEEPKMKPAFIPLEGYDDGNVGEDIDG